MDFSAVELLTAQIVNPHRSLKSKGIKRKEHQAEILENKKCMPRFGLVTGVSDR